MSALPGLRDRRRPADVLRGRAGATGHHWWLLGVGGLLALLLAWLPTQVPALLVLAGVMAVVVVLLIVGRPALGVLLLLVLVTTVDRETLFEQGLPLAGGNLKVTDLLVGLTLFAWAVGRAVRGDLGRLPRPRTMRWLGIFFLLVAASVFTAHAYGTPAKMSLVELRPLLSLLLVFPLVADTRSLRELEGGMVVFLGACGYQAVTTILRYLQGEGDRALFAGGATRVQSVYLYPLVLIIWGVVLLPFARTLAMRSAILALTGLGIGSVFFTFERGSWMAAIAGSVVVITMLPPSRRRRLLFAFVPLVLGAGLLVSVANASSSVGVADPLQAGLDRFQAILALDADVSSRYRINEWTRALEVIAQRPLTGIGIGSVITFENPMWDEATGNTGGWFSTFYIHNTYIWTTLKLGVFGLAAFLTLLGGTVTHGYRRYQAATDLRRRRLLLGAIATLCALGVMALTGQHGIEGSSSPYVALVIALVDLVPVLPIRSPHASERVDEGAASP